MEHLRQEVAPQIGQGIAHVFERFVDPTQRLYFPLLLVSVAVIFGVSLVGRARGSREGVLHTWLHPSARMDYRLLFANAIGKVLLWGGLAVSAVAVAAATVGALESVLRGHGVQSWPGWLLTSIYTLTLFVFLDGSRYLLHRLMHSSDFLWSFHQVHHSAEVLTPLTNHRVHPVESLLYGARGALVTGLVSGAFWYFFNGSAHQAEILGVNAIGLGLNALWANLRHSHVWLGFGRLEAVLMSPAQHQLHHAKEARMPTNLGAFLSIWDRMAGTLVLSRNAKKPAGFGLAQANHRYDSVSSALVAPFLHCAEQFVARAPKSSTTMLAVGALSCGTDPGPGMGPDDGFDREALLQDLGEELIIADLEAAHAATVALEDALSTYCDAIGGSEDAEDASRTAAQVEWEKAMLAWQRCELMNIGPASEDGEDFRNAIYSWPIVSGCAVDQAVVAAQGSFDITAELYNKRGLDSLEYLLFTDSEDSVCPPQVTPEGWEELGSIDRRTLRCDYAQLAAADLADSQAQLLAAWRGDSGYLAQLLGAGGPESPFANHNVALNQVFGGLFYLEFQTKDTKLAAPLGLKENACATTEQACLESVELPLALANTESILANLESFESYYLGRNGQGFSDLVVFKGGSEFDGDFRQRITTAKSAIGNLGILRDTLQSDYQQVRAAYDALNQVSQGLKAEMPAIVELDIPPEAGGETD